MSNINPEIQEIDEIDIEETNTEDEIVYSVNLKELEEEINNSEFLLMNPEEDPVSYEIAANDFITKLCKYSFEIYRNNKKIAIEDLSYELWVAARSCIKSYKPEAGSFSHYYNKSVKSAIYFAGKKEETEQQSVGLIKQSKIKQISKITRWAEEHHLDSEMLMDLADQIAEAVGLSADVVKSAIQAIDTGKVTRIDEQISDDGRVSQLDLIEGKPIEESDIETVESIHEICEVIEEQLFSLRKKAGIPLLSALLTNRIMEQFSDNEKYLEIFRDYRFFDKEMAGKIISENNGEAYLQKEIADMFHSTPANISQMFSRFLIPLSEKIKDRLSISLDYLL